MDAEARHSRILDRVAKELDVPEPVLILNNSCLTTIPNSVLSDQHCTENLRELSLKNNLIDSLVRCTVASLILNWCVTILCSRRSYLN